MGVGQGSCRCLRICRENINEIEFENGEFLRSRTGNFKINNDPRSLTNFQQSKIVTINSSSSKTDFTKNIKSDFSTNNNNNFNYEKETFKDIILEEPELNNKFIMIENTLKRNNKKRDFNEKTRNDSIKYINLKDIDKNMFFTKNLKKAEKNFLEPINYEKDWSQYCDDIDNEDFLALINSMNNNKGVNHTEDEGQVIEYHGKKYLYIGELDESQKPIGFGVLYTQQGEKYEGNFRKGKLLGLGRFINKEGTCFEGIFENGNLISKAKIIKLNDNNKKIEYFGEVIDFKKSGKGEEKSEEYIYNGEFLEDNKDGYGKLEYLQNGDIYEGDFSKGEITGKGKYIWSNKEQYEGDFLNGIKHGKGIYKWPDGIVYEGEYKQGIREGKGKYKWKDGRIFEGMFKNGKPDGKGKLTFKGKTFLCEYKNGKPITDIKSLLKQN